MSNEGFLPMNAPWHTYVVRYIESLFLGKTETFSFVVIALMTDNLSLCREM